MIGTRQALIVFQTAGLLLAGLGFAAEDFSAKYEFQFPGGNLISNWSFENSSEELCKEAASEAMVSYCHYSSATAKSGSFIFRAITDATSTEAYSQKTDYLACESNTKYTLSFFVDALWEDRFSSTQATTSNSPKVWFYGGDKSPGSAAYLGPSYESVFLASTRGWKKYSISFTTGSSDVFLKIAFITSTNSSHNSGNDFQIDNVSLFQTVNESRVVETREIGDAAGRVDQVVKNDEVFDQVAFNVYDEEGRIKKAYLPAAKSVGLTSDLTAIAVGAQNPGEALEYDFSTLTDAYAVVKSIVAQMNLASVGSLVINAVVNNPDDVAPVGGNSAVFSAMKDKNNQPVAFELNGIVKGSPEYLALAARHATTSASHRNYSFSEFTGSLLPAQYPVETDLYSEIQYPNQNSPSPLRTLAALPGNGYGIGATIPHVSASGMAMVSNTDIPTDLEMENRANDVSGAADYIYSWSRDPQGNYSLSWANSNGQVVKSALGNSSHFAVSTLTYDDYGRLIASKSPENMSTTQQFNAQSQIVAQTDPDRGRTDFLYDRVGHLRFMHPAEPAPAPTTMIANKYDAVGRLVETGKTPYNWSQSDANLPNVPSTPLDVGFFWDELSASEFQAKTGVSLASLSSHGFDVGKITHSNGQLAASYNLNSDVIAPGLSAPGRKLVASFYGYDTKGRVEYIYKYLGPLENPDDRLQKIRFVYDDLDRLQARIVYRNFYSDETTDIPSSESDYLYDELGRIVAVLDKDAELMAQYEYDVFGRVSSATLYNKFQIRYQYDIRGALKKIEAVRLGSPAEFIFTENLGYDQKPDTDPSVPDIAGGQKRWDGRISSVLRKFSNDVDYNKVELLKYDYDGIGRLIKSERNRSGSSALNLDGSIDYAGLSFPNQDINRFAYKDDGGLLSQSIPGTTYNYSYWDKNGPTHQVANVSGFRKSGEGMSIPGGENFQYDARGRLTTDHGLSKAINYGFASNQPVKVIVGGVNYHMFYDAAYQRVAEIVETGGTIALRKVYLYETGRNVVKEFIQSGSVVQIKNSLYGQRGKVGIEEEATGKRMVFIKDHLGSLVKVEDENGGSPSGGDEYSYSPFGVQENPVQGASTLKATESYSGKEFEEALKTYYFGARFFDPELAMWLSPDPAFQFFNPYSQGGDPINFVDANGESTSQFDMDDDDDGGDPCWAQTNCTSDISVMIDASVNKRSGGSGGSFNLPEISIKSGSSISSSSELGIGSDAFSGGFGISASHDLGSVLPDMVSRVPGAGESGGGGVNSAFGGGTSEFSLGDYFSTGFPSAANYSDDYFGYIHWGRDVGLYMMWKGGGTKTAGGGYQTLFKNPVQWGTGLAVNGFYGIFPTTKGETALLGAAVLLGGVARLVSSEATLAAGGAEAAADAAFAGGKRAGAAAELRIGDEVFTGVSGEVVPHNPQVTGGLMGTPASVRAPWHGGCAEIVCLDKALNAGVNPAGGSMRAVNIGVSGAGHNTPKLMCSSCVDILQHFEVSH